MYYKPVCVKDDHHIRGLFRGMFDLLSGKGLINALIVHVGTGLDLSDLPKNYSDSAVAD